eukprot:CAMPEP_0182476626 /NCGR_PEP_ID=MMETSP1319-20130603/29449_1 /TAXON_ID=172717 /ORGANISM="Bolidomonas pacifica, Strain RCC208" /LENGTH=490 /DNA_ID=CAMNT_0024677727 /DNA_START=85 /DNA_END=1554 /DNA_ORIENTATION=+
MSEVTIFQTLAALLISAAVSGSSYTFATYSEALKKQFNFELAQLETINISCFCIGFVTFVPGLIGDKLGPRRTIFLGGCFQGSAFALFWAISMRFIDLGEGDFVVAMLSLCLLVQFLGSSCVTGAVFASAVRNFPGQKGQIVGLIKGWVGLCGGMYTQIFVGFVPVDLNDDEDPLYLWFLLVASICCLCATLLPSQFVMVHAGAKERDADPTFLRSVERRVYVGYLILILMGVVVIASALLELHVDHCVLTAFAVAIIFIWASPTILALPVWDLGSDSSRSNGDEALHSILLSGAAAEGEEDQGLIKELGIVEMVKTLNFWLFLWPCVALIGAGIGMTTNVAQMFSAIGSNDNVVATTFFSATQSLTRVLAGLLCDVLKVRGVPAATVLALGLVFMLLAYLLFVVNTPQSLFAGVLCAGVGFGSAWPVMVVVVAELFGQKNLGGNYMVYDGVASAVGAIVFGKLIPEAVYNAHLDDGETECYGSECFRLN